MQRSSSPTILNKLIAFCMSLLFLQALVADIFHADRIEHAYCPTHQDVTHDVAHVDAIRALQLARSQNNTSPSTPPDQLAIPQQSPLNGDHNDSPFDCGELIWLAAGTDAVFYPGFDFAVPPPFLATLPDIKSVQLERDSYPAIALHFHASGLSPPVLS